MATVTAVYIPLGEACFSEPEFNGGRAGSFTLGVLLPTSEMGARTQRMSIYFLPSAHHTSFGFVVQAPNLNLAPIITICTLEFKYNSIY